MEMKTVVVVLLLASMLFVAGDAMATAICRTAGFWGTHGGAECANRSVCNNITQAVIDAAPGGGLEVCGEIIDRSTPIGDLGSALEGVCVKTKGVEQRSLYLQMVAAALNCVVSGDPGCALIPLSPANWEECNDLCAFGINNADSRLCETQLRCWNGGGFFLGGECYLGECLDAGVPTGQFCSSMPDCIVGECFAFEDNCHDRVFSDSPVESLQQFSSPGPASSWSACRRARRNACTIGGCF